MAKRLVPLDSGHGHDASMVNEKEPITVEQHLDLAPEPIQVLSDKQHHKRRSTISDEKHRKAKSRRKQQQKARRKNRG